MVIYGKDGFLLETDRGRSHYMAMLENDKERLSSLEREIEELDLEFRRAFDAGDRNAMLAAHERMCNVMARFSAVFSPDGKPLLLSEYFSQVAELSLPVETAEVPFADNSSPPLSSQDTQVGYPEPNLGDGSIADLEKQIAQLAQRMQACVEAGDMDAMLKINEQMGKLSIQIAAQEESRHKSDQLASLAASETLGRLKEQAEKATLPSGPGGWSAGDTLAFARQRAEERKKQLAHGTDSFEKVVGETGESSEGGSEPDGSTVLELRDKLENYNFYEILAVPSTAPFEEIHLSFVRKLRKLNRKLLARRLKAWQFQEFVAALSLAYEVLKFPNARLQYDLALYRPEAAGGDGIKPAEKEARKMMPLRELLKFSTLIDSKELSQAVEVMKASPERDLGHFLVERGQLSAEELDSILFAQKLVSSGKLTVAQFELAMQEMRENSIPLLDTLVASEWIKPQDIFSDQSGAAPQL